MLGDVAPPAVADPHKRGKLAYLLAGSGVRADERAKQFQCTLRLFLAEPADKHLQSLPCRHAPSVSAGEAARRRAPPVRQALSSGMHLIAAALRLAATMGILSSEECDAPADVPTRPITNHLPRRAGTGHHPAQPRRRPPLPGRTRYQDPPTGTGSRRSGDTAKPLGAASAPSSTDGSQVKAPRHGRGGPPATACRAAGA